MKTQVILYLIISIISIIFIIWIVGLLLPKHRTERRESVFNTSPKNLFEVVIDNQNWQHRSDLKELNILKSENGFEVWEEMSKDGNIIRFKTKEKIPHTYYSFEMESSVITGHWIGEFKELENGNTLFTTTEHIEMKNPFFKVLSYLFFDIGKYMEVYQNDLHTKIATMKKDENIR